eukprot:maker-scaffold_15-snap-gene-2.30-mRNA-1 protein AED:0.05 eAED:0.05 QI:39/0.5/0.33/1/0/0/3/0/196
MNSYEKVIKLSLIKQIKAAGFDSVDSRAFEMLYLQYKKTLEKIGLDAKLFAENEARSFSTVSDVIAAIQSSSKRPVQLSSLNVDGDVTSLLFSGVLTQQRVSRDEIECTTFDEAAPFEEARKGVPEVLPFLPSKHTYKNHPVKYSSAKPLTTEALKGSLAELQAISREAPSQDKLPNPFPRYSPSCSSEASMKVRT